MDIIQRVADLERKVRVLEERTSDIPSHIDGYPGDLAGLDTILFFCGIIIVFVIFTSVCLNILAHVSSWIFPHTE